MTDDVFAHSVPALQAAMIAAYKQVLKKPGKITANLNTAYEIDDMMGRSLAHTICKNVERRIGLIKEALRELQQRMVLEINEETGKYELGANAPGEYRPAAPVQPGSVLRTGGSSSKREAALGEHRDGRRQPAFCPAFTS